MLTPMTKGVILNLTQSNMEKNMSNTEITEIAQTLNNEQRKQFREELIALGKTELPRLLYFNYDTQEWII